MALGTLARHGPRHGHQIRRLADLTNVGEWGGVSVGALYRELRALHAEGLIEAVRTEQVGRRPERTVYAITREGRVELAALREQAIRPVEFGPDSLGVALTFAAYDADREELRAALRARRDRLAVTARELAGKLGSLTAKGLINPLEAAMIRRGELLIATEMRWHDELDELLATDVPLTEDMPAAGGEPRNDAGPTNDGAPVAPLSHRPELRPDQAAGKVVDAN